MSSTIKKKLSEVKTFSKWHYIAGAGLVGMALVIVYWPSFSGPLAFDDYTQLSGTIRFPSFREWLRPESRPLPQLIFALEGCIANNEPEVHRYSSIFVHWLATLMLWRLATCCFTFADQNTRFVSAPLAGLLVALAWTLHPLQTECVAYIIQRSEALMGLFFFAFLCCLCEDHRQASVPVSQMSKPARSTIVSRGFSYRWQLLAVLCFIAGLWSKTVMITALAVGPLFDRAFLSTSWIDMLRRRGYLYILPTVFGVFAAIALLPGILRGDANVGFGGDAPPVSIHLAAQSKIVWEYLWLALLPTDLNIDHGVVAPIFWQQNSVWIALTVSWVAIGIILCLRCNWRSSFIVLTPLIVLSPTSSIVPTADLFVEHRMYLPLAAIVAGCIALSIRFSRMTDTIFGSKPIWKAWFSLWLIALATRTFLRSGDYSSGTQLWSQSVISSPTNDRAIQNFIDAAIRERRTDLIDGVLMRAIEVCQSRQLSPTVPMQRLGEQLAKSNRHQSAIAILGKAIELDQAKDYAGYQTPQRFRDRAAMHVNMALAMIGLSDKVGAKQELERAFEYYDGSPEARAMAGSLCKELSLTADAHRHFSRALELRANWPEVTADLARLAQMEGM